MHDHETDPAAAAAEALRAMFTAYPMGEGNTSLTLTGADGTAHTVPADPGHLRWLADLVARGQAEADRSHPDHPDHGRCPHCREQAPGAAPHAAPRYEAAPSVEELATCPALLVLIGGLLTGTDILRRYPDEWVVSLDEPGYVPGRTAQETGGPETRMTARLRRRLPVVVAPHPRTLGAEASMGRVDLLAVAGVYDMTPRALFTGPEGDTTEEFYARPRPETLANEGWRSY